MFLPICKQDLIDRDIESLDFIMISGDAYVDHHSFGHALVARQFEAEGFSVGIIAQPQCKQDYMRLGVPNIAFLISGGVVDSMVNNYTVAKKKRAEDSYSPGGIAGKRPDRAVTVYCKMLKTYFPEMPVVIGGIEASLRRLSHYDYWSDVVMPSILISGGADLLIYGMGERPIMDICAYLRRGVPIKKIRDVRGTCYVTTEDSLPASVRDSYVKIFSNEEVIEDKVKFAKCFKLQSDNMDSVTAKGLIQPVGEYVVVQNPPQTPMSVEQMDYVYSLGFERTYHPIYEKMGGVPAIEEVKFSITSHRGCYGSCSYCALNFHQGRVIQPRSDESIVSEAEKITEMSDFKGYIHDIGGPTANFRVKACEKQEKSGVCANKYCIGNKKCANLRVSHKSYLGLLQKLRKLPKVKKVFVRSGVRFDYVMYDSDPQFLNELIKYHTSGQLKIAPEHISDKVLEVMNKPPSNVYKEFAARFKTINEKYGLKQYLVPYFISSHPACTLKEAVKLAEFLHSINYMPEQVQDFYPTPSTRSTTMFYCGIDPDTMKEVYVPKSREEKQMQRALLQYRKKENYHLVKKALIEAGRQDLIGFDKKCLIRPMRVQHEKPQRVDSTAASNSNIQNRNYSKRPQSRKK